jgi:DNA-binding transcriptional LysR family regulator
VVLEAVLLERNVTRAAQRLHMSQPAVSRALGRLRTLFGDELMVRVGQQMQPTARGEVLLRRARPLLDGVRELVASERFDPFKAAGVVRLAAPDIIVFMLGPLLLRRLQKDAPQLDVEIVQWSSAWREQLASGEVDLTFGQASPDDRGIYMSPLVQNRWITILRRGHPALRRRWGLESFLELRHLMIGFTSQGGGHVDAALEKLGLRRRIGLRMPYVVLSPLIVAESDLVLTTAHWLAAKLAKAHSLVLKPPPRELELAPVDLPLVWHERSHRDPKQRWLRGLLTELAVDAGMAPDDTRSDANRKSASS